MTDQPIMPKSRWLRRLRFVALALIALMLLAIPVGWLTSMIPSDRPEPLAKEAPAPPRTPNVVPQEAKLPWTRDVNEPAAVVVNEARMPWNRDVHASSAIVHVPHASIAWTRSTTRPKRIDIEPAKLPWKAPSK